MREDGAFGRCDVLALSVVVVLLVLFKAVWSASLVRFGRRAVCGDQAAVLSRASSAERVSCPALRFAEGVRRTALCLRENQWKMGGVRAYH